MPNNQWSQLTELLHKQSSAGDLEKLLMILLAPEERDSIGIRLSILKALLDGKQSQREVAAGLGVSIATITRGSNNLKSLEEADKQFLIKQFGISE